MFYACGQQVPFSQVLFCRCPFHRPPAAGAQLQVPCHRSSAECLQLWFSSEAALALRCWHFGAGHRSQSRALHGLPVYIGAPASSSSATASPANIFFPMGLPGSSISATVQPLARAPRPATSQHSAPASNIFPMALRHGAPASSISATAAPQASNKPHSAEKYSGLASNLAHLGRIC